MTNETFDTEREVIGVCLNFLEVAQDQVVHEFTGSGLENYGEDERFVNYVRKEVFSGFEVEVLHNFFAKNSEPCLIHPALNPDGRLLPVSQKEYSDIFRDGDGWDRFREVYPNSGGSLEFSRVGLNADITQAMLYIGRQWHWTAGNGGVWFLSRFDGEWKAEGNVELWIS